MGNLPKPYHITKMLKSDLEDANAMAIICNNLFEKLNYAKEQILRMDVKENSPSNRVHYKATIQWIDSAKSDLIWEKEPKDGVGK